MRSALHDAGPAGTFGFSGGLLCCAESAPASGLRIGSRPGVERQRWGLVEEFALGAGFRGVVAGASEEPVG